LGEVPAHWEVKKLKHLVTKVGSGITPKGGSENYLTEGIPLIRSQNIYTDGLRMEDVAFISEETHRSMSGSKVFSGDVLLNITGASIGRTYFVEESMGEANVNQHVCFILRSFI
jgi:type I restriction enzyme S subunit